MIAGRDNAFVGRLYAIAPFLTFASMRSLRAFFGEGAAVAWATYALWNVARLAIFAGRAQAMARADGRAGEPACAP